MRLLVTTPHQGWRSPVTAAVVARGVLYALWNPAHPTRPTALAGNKRSCARDCLCMSAQGPIEWHIDAVKALPAPVLRRVNQAIMRAPRYPGLRLPSQGLDTPKLDGLDLLTLAKLLPVALLREPQAQELMTSMLLLLGWLLTRDLAVHTDDTLARLRGDRVKRGPRSSFHGMRSVADRWGGHVAASRLAMGCGRVETCAHGVATHAVNDKPLWGSLPCAVRSCVPSLWPRWQPWWAVPMAAMEVEAILAVCVTVVS